MIETGTNPCINIMDSFIPSAQLHMDINLFNNKDMLPFKYLALLLLLTKQHFK